MDSKSKLIAKQIKSIINDFVPEIGIILGSGWAEVIEEVDNKVIVPFKEITNMPTTSVKGHVGNFVFGLLGGKKVAIMQGRFHMYEGHSAFDSTISVQVLHQLGVKVLIVTNSAGGINDKYNISDIVVINDHINFTAKNPLIGIKPTTELPVFIDMLNAYDSDLVDIATSVCYDLGITNHKGVYAQLLGPNYETPAEIRMLRTMGADVVGMSTVQEVIMARYLGVRVLGISCVTNKGAGMEKVKLDHKDVLKVTQDNKKNFKNILKNVVKNI